MARKLTITPVAGAPALFAPTALADMRSVQRYFAKGYSARGFVSRAMPDGRISFSFIAPKRGNYVGTLA